MSLACRWCQRTVILRELAGLEQVVPVSYVAPVRGQRGWDFSGESFDDGPGGEYVDNANGWAFLSWAYLLSEPSFAGRVSAPVLCDTRAGPIVNNESADIIRLMSQETSLSGLGGAGGLDHHPEDLRCEIDAVSDRVCQTVNDGVYRAGFARTQQAYE